MSIFPTDDLIGQFHVIVRDDAIHVDGHIYQLRFGSINDAAANKRSGHMNGKSAMSSSLPDTHQNMATVSAGEATAIHGLREQTLANARILFPGHLPTLKYPFQNVEVFLRTATDAVTHQQTNYRAALVARGIPDVPGGRLLKSRVLVSTEQKDSVQNALTSLLILTSRLLQDHENDVVQSNRHYYQNVGDGAQVIGTLVNSAALPEQ